MKQIVKTTRISHLKATLMALFLLGAFPAIAMQPGDVEFGSYSGSKEQDEPILLQPQDEGAGIEILRSVAQKSGVLRELIEFQERPPLALAAQETLADEQKAQEKKIYQLPSVDITPKDTRLFLVFLTYHAQCEAKKHTPDLEHFCAQQYSKDSRRFSLSQQFIHLAELADYYEVSKLEDVALHSFMQQWRKPEQHLNLNQSSESCGSRWLFGLQVRPSNVMYEKLRELYAQHPIMMYWVLRHQIVHNQQKKNHFPCTTLEGHGGYIDWSLQGGRNINGVRFNKQENLLASAGADGTARVWSVGQKKCLYLFQHPRSVKDVIFSHQGDLIATACADGMVRVFDLLTQKQLHKYGQQDLVSRAVVFSQDDKKVISAHGNCIVIYDCTSKKSRSLPIHDDTIFKLMVAKNGSMILSFSEDNTIRLCNLEDGTIKTVESGLKTMGIKPHSEHYLAATINNDGTLLVLAPWPTSSPVIVDLQTDAKRELSGHTGAVRSVSFSADEKQLVTSADDGKVLVWDAKTGERIFGVQHDDIHKFIESVQLTDASKLLVTFANATPILWGNCWGKELDVTFPACNSCLVNQQETCLATIRASKIDLWQISNPKVKEYIESLSLEQLALLCYAYGCVKKGMPLELDNYHLRKAFAELKPTTPDQPDLQKTITETVYNNMNFLVKGIVGLHSAAMSVKRFFDW